MFVTCLYFAMGFVTTPTPCIRRKLRVLTGCVEQKWRQELIETTQLNTRRFHASLDTMVRIDLPPKSPTRSSACFATSTPLGIAYHFCLHIFQFLRPTCSFDFSFSRRTSLPTGRDMDKKIVVQTKQSGKCVKQHKSQFQSQRLQVWKR